ncbi:hypothetical protein [Pararhizobium gei]|uniref:hypothetical protein n=1 Tax=Pararhizobium gei TaxID=1395951 RepID=UPI0023DBF904|nr:hypothetical protein [Rhizobium gei]
MHALPSWRSVDRDVALKSSTNCRVSIHDKQRNQFLRCESLLEANLVLSLMANRNVVDIETQVMMEFERETGPTVQYVDTRATYVNGLVMLYPVRPSELDKAGRLKMDVELMRDQIIGVHAHGIEIIDETVVTEGLVYRACAILRARDLRNNRDVSRMTELVVNGPSVVQVFRLLQEFGDLGLGWSALWNLIDDGVLVHDCPDPENTRLNHISWVRVKK